ncbi:ABC transporter substrate-binding protein [Thermomonospora catenispora]|uniref:ABC transporter substrate-binding protein n=1 Tax=Thermomonospora catenispora TaxID=2493090 RepID=UPI0011212C59|nr:ABC transporter substrate-binding protein [Thermomonospora catenispora]TNY36468.1 carbohydrate ABC transporter substrate-binding protein [Thermomonospora catenispora]
MGSPRRSRKRRGLTALAAVLTGVMVAGTACSGDSGDDTITLTVDTFGEFGYEELFKQYEAQHPNIKIRSRKVSDLDTYKPQLQRWIGTGRGAGDVVAIEEGLLPTYMQQADKFVNLFDYGGAELKENFLEWKWQMGVTPDGKQLMALGTDIAPLSMCYRKDLFAKAGLPTDRDEVTKLWPTWDDFFRRGQEFQSKVSGTKWLDGPQALLRVTVLQEASKGPGYSYFDKSNNFVVDSNPAVKTAFDTALKFQEAKLTANLQVFTPPWQTGLKRDAFATVPCPAWMLGGIEEYAGEQGKGKWDLAGIPGGGGYWGGSWLAVPKQSKHPKEAAELAKFLTSPQGQLAAFKAANTFPSSPKIFSDPAVAEATRPYFSDAPIGKLFSEAVSQVKPVYLGPKNEDVRQELENVLVAVGEGKVRPDQAWSQGVERARGVSR